jgi:4'-phosphopantetheinyl transferase
VAIGELDGILPTIVGPLYWLALSEDAISPSANDAPPRWLSASETAIWQSLRTDKRRRDWLLGRRAAKQLLAKLIQESNGRRLPAEQVTILPHANGWPVVALPSLDDPPAITLSISHSRGWAFCAAVEGENQLLGADIEFVEPRAPGFVEEYFTSTEIEFLAAAPPEQFTTLTNAIWSGKEAALKAIRRGLAEDTRIVTCLPHPRMTATTDWLPLRIAWNPERPLPGLTGYWRLNDSFVLTLALTAEAF